MTTFLMLDLTGNPLVEFNNLDNARRSTSGRVGVWLIATDRHNLYSPPLSLAEISAGVSMLKNLEIIADYGLTRQSETPIS